MLKSRSMPAVWIVLICFLVMIFPGGCGQNKDAMEPARYESKSVPDPVPSAPDGDWAMRKYMKKETKDPKADGYWKSEAVPPESAKSMRPSPMKKAPKRDKAGSGGAPGGEVYTALKKGVIDASEDRVTPKLKPANIAFNAPETMMLREEKTVQLMLSEKLAADELKGMIKFEGKKEGASIQITRVMKADLTAAKEAFTITPMQKVAELAVSADSPTEWKWKVRAESPGKHDLQLALYRKVIVYGKERWEGVYEPAFYKVITVEVTWWGRAGLFIDRNESWLKWSWTAILVPLIAWFWNRRTRQKPGYDG